MPDVIAQDGVRVHYRTTGRVGSEPLLLLHGLGSDHRGWMLQQRAFAARYRCLAIDNRGCGRSDVPLGTYSLDRMAADAVAVLEHAGAGPAHVVGASLGGAVALLLAAARPDLVRSLVVACTACRLGPWRRALIERWAEQAEQRGVASVLRHNLGWFVAPGNPLRHPPLHAVAARVAGRAPRAGFVGQCGALLAADDDGAAQLRSIVAPTLVIVGEHDALTPVADARQVAASITGARAVTIAGAGHVVMLERPRTFNRAVLTFLAGARDAAGPAGQPASGSSSSVVPGGASATQVRPARSSMGAPSSPVSS